MSETNENVVWHLVKINGSYTLICDHWLTKEDECHFPRVSSAYSLQTTTQKGTKPPTEEPLWPTFQIEKFIERRLLDFASAKEKLQCYESEDENRSKEVSAATSVTYEPPSAPGALKRNALSGVTGPRRKKTAGAQKSQGVTAGDNNADGSALSLNNQVTAPVPKPVAPPISAVTGNDVLANGSSQNLSNQVMVPVSNSVSSIAAVTGNDVLADGSSQNLSNQVMVPVSNSVSPIAAVTGNDVLADGSSQNLSNQVMVPVSNSVSSIAAVTGNDVLADGSSQNLSNQVMVPVSNSVVSSIAAVTGNDVLADGSSQKLSNQVMAPVPNPVVSSIVTPPDYFKKLFAQHELILRNQTALLRNAIANNAQNASDEEGDENDNENLPDRPFQDLASFLAWDNRLKMKRTMRDKVRASLKSLRQDERKASCFKMTGRIMSDLVVQKFSYLGQMSIRQSEKKGNFSALKTASIIYNLVKRLHSVKGQDDMSELQFQRIMENWIAQAKFRHKRKCEQAELRKKREEKLLERNSNTSLESPENSELPELPTGLQVGDSDDEHFSADESLN